MESIEEIKDILSSKIQQFGISPLFFYFGGSISNGTYESGVSDIDVIVVVEKFSGLLHSAAKCVINGIEYSVLFDCFDEYRLHGRLKDVKNSKLFGYLNFYYVKISDIAIVRGEDQNRIRKLFEYSKHNAIVAAEELVERWSLPHLSSKEDYHLLQALNLLGKSNFSHKEIMECKRREKSLQEIMKENMTL